MPDSSHIPAATPDPVDQSDHAGQSDRADPFARQPQFPFGEELKIRMWAGLAFAVLWFLKVTTRKHYIWSGDLLSRWGQRDQVIMAFWHSRMLLMRFAYRGRKAVTLNSIHRDGEIVARVLKRFGITAVRGSSSRGWVGGLKGMVAAHRLGYDLIVVPDGPRGPRDRVKSGVLQLARATGAPVYPTTYSAAWHIRIKSWDRLMIPFPFSRAVYMTGPPIFVPKDATPEQMEHKRQQLEERLLAITHQADAYFDKR